MTQGLLLSLVLAAGSAEPAEPAAADPERLGVFNIRMIGLDEDLGRTAVDVVATTASATDRFEVVSSTEIIALLDQEVRKQLLGCEDDTSCLAEIGMAVGVDLVLAGSATRVDEVITTARSAIDPDDTTTEAAPEFDAHDFLVTPTYLYWIENDSVYRQERGLLADRALLVADQAESIHDLHRDGSNFYWVRLRTDGAADLVTWDDTALTQPVVLYSDPTGELRISAADEHRIYWWSAGDLLSIGKRGG